MQERIAHLSAEQRAQLYERVSRRLTERGERAPSVSSRLVAYIVADGPARDGNDYRDALRAQLPEYLIPEAFVALESLPVAPNGKVDKSALPNPTLASMQQDTFVAPESDAEVALAEIWSEVLGIEEIGAHDNFFELGGHSLLVNQITARIRDIFGVELSLRVVFDAATIAELALVVESALIAELEASEEPLAE